MNKRTFAKYVAQETGVDVEVWMVLNYLALFWLTMRLMKGK